MKKAILTFVAIFSLLGTKSIFAQTASSTENQIEATMQKNNLTPEARATKMTTILKDSLALTDAQYTKIYDINLKAAQQTDAAIKVAGKSTLTAQSKIKAINQLRDAAIKKQLTPEQLAAYNAMKQNTKTTVTTKTNQVKTTQTTNKTTHQQKIQDIKSKYESKPTTEPTTNPE